MDEYVVGMENTTQRIREYFELHLKTYRKLKISDFVRTQSIYVENYIELVKEIAQLSIANPRILLYFRGQKREYKLASSEKFKLYPSLYRSERMTQSEKDRRFETLKRASDVLCDLTQNSSLLSNQGMRDLRRIDKVQWSLLQHYGVCDTPLLDVTQSLRVACSFALNDNPDEFGYIFVVAMPFPTGRISISSEESLCNIRLLSICPPQALRPFFQEGFLIGTEYPDYYFDKSEMDFVRRLVAAYRIPVNEFWKNDQMSSVVGGIDNALLFPENDEFGALMDNVTETLKVKGLIDSL